jgi:hypothetical protein
MLNEHTTVPSKQVPRKQYACFLGQCCQQYTDHKGKFKNQRKYS